MFDLSHWQEFWKASGSFFQSQWSKILFYCGDDEFNLFVYGKYKIAFNYNLN